jgi:integrase
VRRRRRRGEGAVFPGQRGRWIAQVGYTAPDGKRKYLTRVLLSEQAARSALPALLARVGPDRGSPRPRPTLDDLLAEWLERVEPSIRLSTSRSYSGHVRMHLSPLLGGVRVDELRIADVERLVRDRQKAGLSGATIRRILTTLSMALNMAVVDGTLARNVATMVRRPKVARHEITAMTPDQARAVLTAVAGDRLAPLYELLLGSGMRVGEAVGLNWGDVDLDQATVFVRHGKTARSVRTIPVPPNVAASLRAHRARAGTIDRHAPLFTGERKGQRLRVDVALHRFTELLEAARLPRMRLHDLRHAHATLLLAAGVPMQLIADQLGHANQAMTAQVYAHVQPGALRAAVNALDDVMRQR